MPWRNGERTPQIPNRRFRVASFLPTASKLNEDSRSAAHGITSGAGRRNECRIAVDCGQCLESFLITRTQARHFVELFCCASEIAQAVPQHLAQPKHQFRTTFAVSRERKLDVIEARNGAKISKRAIDLTSRFNNGGGIGTNLGLSMRGWRLHALLNARDVLLFNQLHFSREL